MSVCDADFVDKDTTFESVGLDPRLLKACEKLQWRHPTLVQAQAIPFGSSFVQATRMQLLYANA
jgi:hypothetical protein